MPESAEICIIVSNMFRYVQLCETLHAQIGQSP